VKLRFSWERLRIRFGVYQPVAFVCSTFGMFIALGAASSLWFWTLNDNPNSLRSRIALAGWTASAIAISSALLRVCIAVHLGTCCMMFASLAFEKNCVLLKDAATMSMYRYAANAPYSMVFPVLRGTCVGKNLLGISLLALLLFLTVVSQFISTILLSDTGPEVIAGNIENVSLPYMYGNPRPPGRLTFQHKPADFPRFAELATKSFDIRSSNSMGPAISDTGPTVRALLPLKTSKRSSLLYYSGEATFIDSHVLCVSPQIDQLQYSLNNSKSPRSIISGKFSAPILADALALGELAQHGSFARNKTRISPIFTVTACYYNRDNLCPVEVSDEPRHWQGEGGRFPVTSLLSGTKSGVWWLVVRNSGFDGSTVHQYDLLDSLFRAYNKTGYSYNGTEWTTKQVLTSRGVATVELSICFSTFQLSSGTIEVKADSNVTEPQYSFNKRPGYSFSDYNTTLIKNQLRAGTQHSQEWGIFNFANYTINVNGWSHWPLKDFWKDRNSTIKSFQELFHEIYYDIYQNTLLETKNAPFALQAIFTLFTANYYYDALDRYNIWTNSTIQAVQPVNIPTMKRGLFIVYAIIGLHFLSVGLIFWLYFASELPKDLDQSWQTVSQLYCGDAREFLDLASNLGDHDIKDQLSETTAAKWEHLVQISVHENTTISCKTPEIMSYLPLHSPQGMF